MVSPLDGVTPLMVAPIPTGARVGLGQAHLL